MPKSKKFYVVWKGRAPGIFDSWAMAAAQVNGFAGAQYKAYDTRGEAERAFTQGHIARGEHPPYDAKPLARWQQLRLVGVEPPILPSYCADAACSGNPGVLEYRAVKTETGDVLFERGPFPEGTNNIGEFLALVEALMLLCAHRDTAPLYSDSKNARAWVKAKRCKTQLTPNPRNAELFERLAQAEEWLRTHDYPNKILKWDTANWGENPADYERK